MCGREGRVETVGVEHELKWVSYNRSWCYEVEGLPALLVPL